MTRLVFTFNTCVHHNINLSCEHSSTFLALTIRLFPNVLHVVCRCGDDDTGFQESAMAVQCYGNATFSSIGYFYRSLRRMRATVAPHQSCHAADSNAVCIPGTPPPRHHHLLLSRSPSVCGPATAVMRPECTIRACHTPTAGAAPQPRPGYRLKHPLINTVLPLPPRHARTPSSSCLSPPHSANKKVACRVASIIFFSFCTGPFVYNTATAFIETRRGEKKMRGRRM